jgi:hypothetical protein
MTRISSRTTFFYKRIFPTMWFGMIGFLVVTTAVGAIAGRTVPPEAVIIPVVMTGFGYLLMKNLLFDLADEAWDAGSHLVVKNRGVEQRVALKDVVNVSYAVVSSPNRVVLSLREATVFGKEIAFAAPIVWIPFAKSPIIEDLIRRIDVARGS